MKLNKTPFVVSLPKKSSPELEEVLEPVSSPHEHDVLCGRGGLTNHHLGNAWYRQLVRSNRELYRNSQKHTKLLIAKAIVNHVQEQNPPGRFLEIDKKTGLWIPVSFKRAVEKTSQALREKDRENEGVIDAKVLMKMEEIAEEEEEEEENIDQICNEGETLEKPDELQPIELNSSSSWFWRREKKAKLETSIDQEDPLPLLSEPITKRASSIFQFLLQSKLTDEKTSATTVTNDLLNNSQHGNLEKDHDQRYEPSPAEFQQLNIQRNIQDITVETMNAATAIGANQSPQAFSGFQHRQVSARAREGDDMEAPILSRLKSQVSDWLQSFFPVNEDLQRHQLQQILPPTQGLGHSNSMIDSHVQYVRQSYQHHTRVQEQISNQNFQVNQQESGQGTQSQLQQNPMKNRMYQHLMMMHQSIFNLEHQIVSNQNGKSILTLRQLQQQMQELSKSLVSPSMDAPSQHQIGLFSTWNQHVSQSRPGMIQHGVYPDRGVEDMRRSLKRGSLEMNTYESPARGDIVDISTSERNHSGLLMPPPSNHYDCMGEGIGKGESSSSSSHTIAAGNFEPAFGVRASGTLFLEDED
jgi:hypothetical protein